MALGLNPRGGLIRMAQEKHKIKTNMPTIGRVTSAAFGLFLVAGSATVFLAVRPLNWDTVWVVLGPLVWVPTSWEEQSGDAGRSPPKHGFTWCGEVATNAPPKFYYVGGEGVMAPGRFVYEPGVTLSRAIKLTGRCTRWALKNKVQLIRPGELSARDVNLSQIELGKTKDLTIQPGDYVLVKQASRFHLVGGAS